jgi:hypothetical protein
VNTARSIASALPFDRRNHAQPDTGSLRDRITTSTRLMPSALKLEQLLTSGRRCRLRELLEALELQLDVGPVVARVEQRVLLLEVEQRAAADRDDELVGRRGSDTRGLGRGRVGAWQTPW